MRWYLLWGSLVTLQWQSSHFEGPSAVYSPCSKGGCDSQSVEVAESLEPLSASFRIYAAALTDSMTHLLGHTHPLFLYAQHLHHCYTNGVLYC